jgi:hypothetical protein
MVNVWEGVGSHAEASMYCDMWQVDGTVLVDEPGEYAKELGIRGVPCNVFVDSGVVTAVTGVRPEELDASIRALLGPDADIDDE